MRIKNVICYIKTKYFLGLCHVGWKTTIFDPLQIDNPKAISINNNTHLCSGAWLMGGGGNDVTLKIGENCTIGHFAHFVGLYGVELGNNILVADKVFITDCKHNYNDISLPVFKQGVSIIKRIKIGDGTHIGENVCILGANIGKNCVIGANSVVTHDIPDYSIACGSPAIVIKKYDFAIGDFVKVRQ